MTELVAGEVRLRVMAGLLAVVENALEQGNPVQVAELVARGLVAALTIQKGQPLKVHALTLNPTERFAVGEVYDPVLAAALEEAAMLVVAGAAESAAEGLGADVIAQVSSDPARAFGVMADLQTGQVWAAALGADGAVELGGIGVRGQTVH